MMRCCSKEKISNNNPPKTNNVICHVCPSKLSKRELEDLYFTVAQNNLELKQTINQLSEKIRYQTTKLQRMLNTQQTYMGSEPRDCCATAKAIVQEQKLVIIELKNANEDLHDQVNNLNMKLCSTKQFMNRSIPAKNTPRNKAQARNSPTRKQKTLPRTPTAKNSSSSALHRTCVEEAAQSAGMKSVSCQYFESAGSKIPIRVRKQKTVPPVKSKNVLNTEIPNKVPNKMCDENKCKTQMEEMQQKILKLQEELAKTHDEYANRIARLEQEVIDLHSENMHVRTEKAMFEQNVKVQSNEAGDINKKLAETESRCEKLTAHLNIEKGKVAELQTQVKAASMTGGVRTIEERFNNGNTINTRRDSVNSNRSVVAGGPNYNANEPKYTENKNLQETCTCLNKNKCYNENVNYSRDINVSQSQEERPGNSQFAGNLKEMYNKYVEAEENNFKISVDCHCTIPKNTSGDKNTATEGQPDPISSYDTTYKLNKNGDQIRQENKSQRLGYKDEFPENQASLNKPSNRRTSVTSHDIVKYRENIDQDGVKYRENLASRLRNKDRPADELSRDTDALRENISEFKEQGVRDHNAHVNSHDVVKLDNNDVKDGGDKHQNTNDRRLGVSQRIIIDKNIESGADKCLKPVDGPVDYTTEYGSQYRNYRKNSLGFRPSLPECPEKTTTQKSPTESKTLYGTDVIPGLNEKGVISPPMSELVNKSNESSCYCSGQCQCVKSTKVTPPTAESVVETATLSVLGKNTPLSAADEEVMKRFKSLFMYTPIELGESPPQQAQNPESPPQQAQNPELPPQQAQNPELLSQQVQQSESLSQSAQKPATRGETSEKSADTSTAKTADDSGFTEPDVCCAATPEGKALLRENKELEKRVAEMQVQLNQIKTHVLSRKKTYTVFKDEATTSDAEQKPECGIQNATIPFDASAQTDAHSVKVDPRRVCLKVPRKGYVVIEHQPDQEKHMDQCGKIERTVLKGSNYNSPGPTVPDSDCESTCVREGLPCTKECLLDNKKKDSNQQDAKQSNRRNDNDIRYQIPGPLPAYSSDVPATRYVYEQNNNTRNLQPTQFSTNASRRLDESNRGIDSPQNANFYESINSGVPQNTGFIKEESPPTSRTQYINMRDMSSKPDNQEANSNARYARETPLMFNNQYGKNGDEPQFGKPLNARTIQHTNDPSHWNMDTPKSIQLQENGEDCCTKHQRLQEALAKSKAIELTPLENETMSGKNTPIKNASKVSKKVPVKCMCPRNAEYTTNILHTATGPIIVPNFENAKDRTSTSQSNAENVTSSNSPQFDFQQNVTNVEENSRIRPVPGYNGGLGVSSKERRELFEFEGADHSKTTKSVPYEEGQEQITFDKNPLSLKQTKRIKCEELSDEQKEHNEKNCTMNGGKERNVATKTGDKQDSSSISNGNKTDLNIKRYEKSSGTEVNNANKNNKGNRPAAHFIDKDNDFELTRNKEEQIRQRRLTRFVDSYGHEKNLGDNKRENEIQNNKVQQKNHPESRFFDINGRERLFIENTTESEILNVVKKQEERRRNSRLSGKIKEANNCTDKTRQEDFLNHFQQPKSTPVATSSPFTCTSKKPSPSFRSDKATDNQLGTQQVNADGNKETEPNTYTIEASAKVEEDKSANIRVLRYSRATSPENTDQEISSLTDLPSERETTTTPTPISGCRKCARYSPGEDKSTTAQSETVTSLTSSSPKPTSFPLSEGEMPQYSARSNKQQRADINNDPNPLEEKRKQLRETSSLKVEQALASISEELARCRLLLEKPKEAQSQKKERENTTRLKDLVAYENLSNDERDRFEGGRGSRGTMMSPTRDPSSLALHHAQAKPHISNGPDTPHVMFTLHIGTIVLSDEAVINTRNLSLVLTWKFYDQNVAMTHMRPGRVVHFDFSTEYDLKLTDHFLQYLKTEELQIKVCELNKLDSPVVSCSLPLREALLHTNRRADMSLALVAGPYMQRSASDTLDTRDEMGVLDLWCMLRAEARIVPRINKAITKSRPSRINGNGMRQQSYANSSLSPLIMQLDDDQDDVHLSADLDQTFQQPDRLPVQDSNNLIDRGAQQELSNQMRQERRRLTNYGYINPDTGSNQSKNVQQFMAYPSPRPRVPVSGNPPKSYPGRVSSTNTDINTQKESNLKRTASGFIINEVPAAIRSDEQMKQAVRERSKLTNQSSTALTLQNKYAEAQARTSHVSYGEISIPSLRFQRKYSTSPQADNSSLILGPSAYSVSRDWKKADIKDPALKKFIEAEPTREPRRESCYTITDRTEARTSRYDETKRAMEAYKTVKNNRERNKLSDRNEGQFNYEENKRPPNNQNQKDQTIDIVILWLALNEECPAMSDPTVQRLYVAYSFLGRSGAELETPQSLPKPKQYQDKCYFNFKKSFQLTDVDLATVGRLARCRYPHKGTPNPKDSVVFTVVSEPVEDPLGLNNCEDIGTAHLYFGDLIAYSADNDTYTEVIPIHDSKADDFVCGVLSIRVDGLNVVRKCLTIY